MKQEIKTNRELIAELLSRLHPEANVNDDETLFGLIYDDYEQYAQLIETHDTEISEARAQGEVCGRNAKIEELMDTEPATDGIPALGGANTSYRTSAASIFDLARG